MIMKKVVFLPISLLMMLLVLTWGCEDDSTEDDTTDESCVRFDSPTCSELTFNACSDDGGDYYEYEEAKYYCSDYYEEGDEDDCSGAAAQIVVDSGCATTTSSVSTKSALMSSYTSFVLDAMIEVRAQAKAAAGCN